jgi:hypothetical protein
MKYTKSIDIWNLGAEQVAALQVGQWVYAGTNEAMSRGRYLGVKPSGSVVVAWHGNAKSRAKYWDYQRALLNYARG